VSDKRQEGQCRCGAVRFTVTGKPILTFACHCTGCQRMSSSAFSLSSLYTAHNFEHLSGATELGGLKGGTRHSFCSSCLSWLWTVPDGMDDYVNIRSTLLADPSAHRPFIDCWLTEGIGWASSGACKGYEQVPEPHEFEALAAEYAAWDGEVKS
jgi:hypothetical protein